MQTPRDLVCIISGRGLPPYLVLEVSEEPADERGQVDDVGGPVTLEDGARLVAVPGKRTMPRSKAQAMMMMMMMAMMMMLMLMLMAMGCKIYLRSPSLELRKT
jgi:ABC-type Na+ efflux pump permease subunit